MKRVFAVLMVLALTVTSIPSAFITEAYAATGSADTRVADGPTLDGWKKYFGESDNNFSTKYSGHVWTDKTVMKDASEFSQIKEHLDSSSVITMNASDSNNFLVALSAMASSESVKGEANKPTDTMIVLDLSSSMYNYGSPQPNPETIGKMVDAVNNMITELQALNANNRVGVTVYFGGPDLLQAKKDSYQIWLPLDRYIHSSNKFLTIAKSGTKLSSVGVNSNVKDSSGKAVTKTTRSNLATAGTYTQQGILSALSEFMAADPYVPMTAPLNPGMPRIPVMVLMTDGEPTAATNKFSDLNQNAIMGSNRVASRSANETDFLTQLTAAYSKAMMDSHYVEEEPLFYTLSLGSSISYDVVDPSDTLGVSGYNPSSTISGYWNKLVTNGSFSMKYKICKGQWDTTLVEKTTTVSRVLVDGKPFPSSTSQREYVDKAFVAANASAMTDAFKNIFADISLQTHTYPTLVEDNENLDGYVSFVDKIGKYMSVTDVKGIILDAKWYSGEEFAETFKGGNFGTSAGKELISSINERLGITDAETIIGLAYENGQIGYNSSTGDFSNYLGWYADENGNYIGFWHEGVTNAPEKAVFVNKSYFYLGETDESHGVSKSDMMYTSVRHATNIVTGEETIAFGVPAALIPTVEYDVELNESGTIKSLKKSGAKSPIRLVYEVALDDEINELTVYDPDFVDPAYAAEHTDANGNVYFYTNQYEADNKVGYGAVNTYSYFRPSHSNESYYYQENATIYSAPGTVYTGANRPSGDGYYRALTVYKKSGAGMEKEIEYIKIASDVLATAKKGSGNSWYVPNGNVFLNVSGYLVEKVKTLPVRFRMQTILLLTYTEHLTLLITDLLWEIPLEITEEFILHPRQVSELQKQLKTHQVPAQNLNLQ